MIIENMSRKECLFLIESLRSGIPIQETVSVLPSLRIGVTDTIKQDMEAISSGSSVPGRIVWGDYGQGKSHFLKTVEKQALSAGFAVSMLSLNRNIASHNLLQLFQHLICAVRTPNTNINGFYQYLENLDKNHFTENFNFNTERYEHELPLTMLRCLAGLLPGEESFSRCYEFLNGEILPKSELKKITKECGEPHLLKNMPSFKKNDPACARAFFGLMADFFRFLGFKGWIILIDEMELIGRLGRKSRLKSYLHLNWLLNLRNFHSFPLYTVCAAATSLDWRSPRGRREPEVNDLTSLAEMENGLVAAERISLFFDQASGKQAIKLLPITRSDLQEMFLAISQCHAKAFDYQPDPDLSWLHRATASFDANTQLRTWVRAILEACDIRMVHGIMPEIQETGLYESLIVSDESGDSEEEKNADVLETLTSGIEEIFSSFKL
jgi:hypothetical protein